MSNIGDIAANVHAAVAMLPVGETQKAQASLLRACEIMGGLAVGSDGLDGVHRACMDALHSVERVPSVLLFAQEQLDAYLADIGAVSVSSVRNSSSAAATANQPLRLERVISPQERKNRELLSRSELGPILLAAYDLAIATDAQLGDIEIAPLPAGTHHVAFAQPAWKSSTGLHRIYIKLTDIGPTLDSYNSIINSIVGGRKYFADMLDVEETQITPTMLYIHSVLHELGHVPEYAEYADQPEQLKARQVAEKRAMPAGNVSVSRLLALPEADRQRIEKQLATTHQNLNIPTFNELIARQFTAYRNLTSEKRADDFANTIIQENQLFRDQLTHRTPSQS
jgi:hypothetical protein